MVAMLSEKVSPPMTNVPGIGLMGLRLGPYNRQDIENLFPLQPQENHGSRDIADVVRQSVTKSNERPYGNANGGIYSVSPEDIPILVRPTTTYLNNHAFENLYYLDINLRLQGIDLFNLTDVAIFRDLLTDSPAYIAPPILEKNNDGTYSVVDGHHRLYLAMLFHIPINCYVVEGFDQQHRNPYQPLNWDDIQRFDGAPDNLKKHQIMPGHDPDDVVEMSLAGDKGSRLHGLIKERDDFHQDPTRGPKELVRRINRVLRELKVPGLFPSAVDREAELHVESVSEVIPIDNNFFLPVINISKKLDDGSPHRLKYIPIAETSSKAGNPANLVVLTSREQPFLEESPPAGELSIPEEIRAQINDILYQRGQNRIAPFDNRDLNPFCPQVNNFHFIDINDKFYSILVLELEDGRSSGFLSNRREPATHREGTTFVIRTPEDQIIFVQHYRELFGLTFLEVPREFGFDLERIRHEIGYNLSTDTAGVNHNVPENRQWGNTDNTIFSVKLSPGQSRQANTIVSDKYYGEGCQVVEHTDSEIHQMIAAGEVGCDFTNTAITIDQLNSGKLVINPDQATKLFVILEKFYSPLRSRYYFRPPKAKNGSGQRLGKNTFQNTGTALMYNHTEVDNNLGSLPYEKCYQSFSIAQAVEMMKNGKLDLTSIATLSTVFRNRGLLILD